MLALVREARLQQTFSGGGAALGERTLIAFGLALARSERGEECEGCLHVVGIVPDNASNRTDETLNGGRRIGLRDEGQPLQGAATSRMRERGGAQHYLTISQKVKSRGWRSQYLAA